MTITKTIFL